MHISAHEHGKWLIKILKRSKKFTYQLGMEIIKCIHI